jgi:hypothetical protein
MMRNEFALRKNFTTANSLVPLAYHSSPAIRYLFKPFEIAIVMNY